MIWKIEKPAKGSKDYEIFTSYFILQELKFGFAGYRQMKSS